MQLISNATLQTYQIPFIRSSTTNFCGKMVCLIDQVNLKISNEVQAKLSDSSRRIVIIAITIFSLAALAYWMFKNCSTSEILAPPPPKPPATLTSEIDYAKEDILQRFPFDDSMFADTESAKLFVSILHGVARYSRERILLQNIDSTHILEDFELLFSELQDEIKNQEIAGTCIFDPTLNTKVCMGILAKDKKVNSNETPFLSMKIIADATVHNGKTLSSGTDGCGNVIAKNNIIDEFCETMEILKEPQFDAEGNFI